MADAGRVIAGTARGTRLVAPGEGTRPLGDRVKQTLFAVLEPDLPGASFLDLFAGSGAAGIEALSRERARDVRGRDEGSPGHRHEPRPPGSRGAADRADRLVTWWGRSAAPAHSMSPCHPPASRDVLLAALERSVRCSHRAHGSWPSTSGATRRRSGSGC
jgi:hypothetical protein